VNPVDKAARVIPRRKPEAGFRVLEGQAIIAVSGRSEVHLLNEVGTRIWQLIDGQRGEDQIAAEIETEFEVTHEQAVRDVNEFVRDLTERGMIE
jgi:hypothetical protein